MSSSKQVGCWIAVSVHVAVQIHLEYLGSNNIPAQATEQRGRQAHIITAGVADCVVDFPHIRDPDSVPLA